MHASGQQEGYYYNVPCGVTCLIPDRVSFNLLFSPFPACPVCDEAGGAAAAWAYGCVGAWGGGGELTTCSVTGVWKLDVVVLTAVL